jgi:hypothetical protein
MFMFYNNFGDFLNNPPLLVLTLFFRKISFLVFWTFRELWDSKKDKVKEHGSEFSRRMLWDIDGDKEPNRLQMGSPHAVRFPGRVGHSCSPLVAPMPSIFIPVALS